MIPLVDDISNEILPQYYNFNFNNPNVVTMDFLKLERGEEKINEDEKDFLMSNLCLFKIARIAHKNILKDPNLRYLQYCNYFYEYFDTDKSFFVSMLYVKRTIDNTFVRIMNNETEDLNVFTYEYFTQVFLEKILLNKRNLDKIYDMVIYNNVVIDYEEKPYTGAEYSKFTKVHCDLLYELSIVSRLIMPVVNHFIVLLNTIIKGTDYDIEGNNKNLMMNNIAKYTIYIVNRYFSNKYGTTINILQKLNESIINNAESTFTSNHLLFNKLVIFGKSSITLTEKILDSVMTSAFLKYIFNSNIIHLNIAFVNNIKENEKNFKSKFPSQEINETDRDSDGLSKLDKLEIDIMKENESKLILVKVNIAKTIEYLIKEYGTVSSEEKQYYMNNIDITERTQVNMVSLWFAKYFSSTNMLKYVKIDQYATLIAIMMRMMKRKGFIILQYLLCGKVIRINKKSISAKILNKIKPRIDKIIETKYTRTSQTVEKSEVILNMIKFALFADMELISYDNEKMRGIRIDVNRVSEDLIIEEVLRFINEI